jgi:CBS domain-containing protein
MIPLPAALVVAHPGHELRLHRWLEVARPLVFVVTDGSGSGRSRISSTIEILETLGCAAGSIVGAFTDRDIYRLILNGDVDQVVAMTVQLADSLIEHDIRSVVADAFELYNPTHDLCSVMASLAAERVCLMTGRSLTRCEYAVTRAPSGNGETLDLDDAAVARKLAAAHRYGELSLEVETLIARLGMDALRREVLNPVATAGELPKLASKPFYEIHGEKRVAAGHYSTVIRYEQHFRPFVERLSAAVRAIPAPAAHHACRS